MTVYCSLCDDDRVELWWRGQVPIVGRVLLLTDWDLFPLLKRPIGNLRYNRSVFWFDSFSERCARQKKSRMSRFSLRHLNRRFSEFEITYPQPTVVGLLALFSSSAPIPQIDSVKIVEKWGPTAKKLCHGFRKTTATRKKKLLVKLGETNLFPHSPGLDGRHRMGESLSGYCPAGYFIRWNR